MSFRSRSDSDNDNEHQRTRQKLFDSPVMSPPDSHSILDDLESQTESRIEQYGRLIGRKGQPGQEWIIPKNGEYIEFIIDADFEDLPEYRTAHTRGNHCRLPRNGHMQFLLHSSFAVEKEVRYKASWDFIKQLKEFLREGHCPLVEMSEILGLLAVSIFRLDKAAILDILWPHTLPSLCFSKFEIDGHPAQYYASGLKSRSHLATLSFLYPAPLPVASNVESLDRQLSPHASVLEIWQATQYEYHVRTHHHQTPEQPLGQFYLLIEVYRKDGELTEDAAEQLELLPRYVTIAGTHYPLMSLRKCVCQEGHRAVATKLLSVFESLHHNSNHHHHRSLLQSTRLANEALQASTDGDDEEDVNAVDFIPHLVRETRLVCQRDGYRHDKIQVNFHGKIQPTLPGGFKDLPPFRKEVGQQDHLPMNNHVQYRLHANFQIRSDGIRNQACWDFIKQLKSFLKMEHGYSTIKAEEVGHIPVSIIAQGAVILLDFTWSTDLPSLSTFNPQIDGAIATFHARDLSCQPHHVTIAFLAPTSLPLAETAVEMDRQLGRHIHLLEMWQDAQYERMGPKDQDRSKEQQLGRYFLLVQIYSEARILTKDASIQLQSLPPTIVLFRIKYGLECLRP